MKRSGIVLIMCTAIRKILYLPKFFAFFLKVMTTPYFAQIFCLFGAKIGALSISYYFFEKKSIASLHRLTQDVQLARRKAKTHVGDLTSIIVK